MEFNSKRDDTEWSEKSDNFSLVVERLWRWNVLHLQVSSFLWPQAVYDRGRAQNDATTNFQLKAFSSQLWKWYYTPSDALS